MAGVKEGNRLSTTTEPGTW